MVLIYKREPLEEDEIQLLRNKCKSFCEKLIINVLLETGLRVSEFCSLNVDMISWQRDCITIWGKGDRRRIVPMSNIARKYLIEYFRRKDRIKMTPRRVQQIVKEMAERAGLRKKVTPHVFRHTFAVTYLHRGGNLRALQGILGHSSIQTTDVYLNYSGQRVIEDFRKVWSSERPVGTVEQLQPF